MARECRHERYRSFETLAFRQRILTAEEYIFPGAWLTISHGNQEE